jgi:hypothetical protein
VRGGGPDQAWVAIQPRNDEHPRGQCAVAPQRVTNSSRSLWRSLAGTHVERLL